MPRDWFAVPYTRGAGAQVGWGQPLDYPHFIEFTDTLRELPFVYANWQGPLPDLDTHLSTWWQAIAVGGYLVLRVTLPPEAICAILEPMGGWDLLENDHDNQSVCMVFQKLAGAEQRLPCVQTVRPLKRACVVRYGGFGDMLQVASILPQLKRQGFEVTVMTTPKGQDILRHDPHVDRWFIQDDDQVPNPELGAYWDFWRPRFDRWINLTMSMEGSLLVVPSDFRSHWPKEAIHAFCDHNYMEVTAKIAAVPFVAGSQKFYPSAAEVAWAVDELAPLDGKQVILWTLSGSSVHKVSPYTDNVIARVLSTYPDAHFILVGDGLCQMLEIGWENESRVWRRSGQYSIRQTLTLAQEVDLVIGPETGVMLSVGMEPVHKVLMLSHSTKENLSKHWVNTTNLIPRSPCYPCHKLHYGWGTCPTVQVDAQTKACACAADLDTDRIYKAVRDHLNALRQAA